MKETSKAGMKEAIFAVLWGIAVIIAYDLTDTALRLYAGGGRSMNLILTIAAVAAECVIVYFVLTRYAASFTYELGSSTLKLTRRIGHSERTAEIKYRNIKSFSRKKPDMVPKPVHKMRKTVFSGKNTYYIIYKNGSAKEMAVFEPSKEMAAEILSRMKEG